MARVACVGIAVHDRIFFVPGIPTEPTKVYARALAEAGGGPAATASVAIAKLGGSSLVVGRVGADETGATIVRELTDYGVEVEGLKKISGARSAWSSVAVDPQGNRLILNFPGEGLAVEPSWIETSLLQGAGAVLADMGWPAGARRALSLARELGIPSVLDADLSPHPDAGQLLELADHVFFSEPGLRRYAGETDLNLALAAMRERLPRAVLGVTVGADGCLWYDGDRLVHEPGFLVDVVDTLGAGDAFHGAYALRIAEGATIRDAIRFAHAVAALKCTRTGGRTGLPARGEVERFLASARADGQADAACS